MTETLAYGYSSESTPRELSYEYPHDFARTFCIFVLWMKVALELEGLNCVKIGYNFVELLFFKQMRNLEREFVWMVLD